MSSGDDEENSPNRTVFRPSPLKAIRDRETQAPGQATLPTPSHGWSDAPQADPASSSSSDWSATQMRQAFEAPLVVASADLSPDDIQPPSTSFRPRNPLMAKASALLVLAANIRSGRARMPLPQLHARALNLLVDLDRSLSSVYPDVFRQRAKYGLCATIDDIVQNLPGDEPDRLEWARRSLVVTTFQEAIGGARFWELVDDMLVRPDDYADLIELYHACLAVGFEGRYRRDPDGKRARSDIMAKLYASIGHARVVATADLSPHWRGSPTPTERVGFWSILALAGGGALAILVVAFIVFKVILLEAGQPSLKAMRDIIPESPLRLSRTAKAPPLAASSQASTLEQFLAQEISQKLVVVVADSASVRVRTTVGQLFKPGSDQLDPGREELFKRIAAAIETQSGVVTVEGYTDSDPIHALSFPDNVALSQARAETVVAVLKTKLANPARVSGVGYGAARPLVTNLTADGKAQNRRVEIVVPRTH